jgi:ferrous-iron efflux pump FieF
MSKQRPWQRYASYASVAVAATLIAAKLAAYLVTDAVSVLSALMDSSVDLLASLMTMFSIARALRPPDHDHRFGHGKAEPLAALCQTAFVGGSGLFLAYEAIARLTVPHPVRATTLGIAVMLFSLALTGALILFQHFVVRRTGSIAIQADGMHYSGDLLAGLAVIISLLLTDYSGWPYWDPLFAIGLAAFLIVGAARIARTALDVLMDRELPDEARDRIIKLAMTHPQARGVHDLRTRSTGSGAHIEFHLELDPHLTLMEAHAITDAIETTLRTSFPRAELTIHQEPAGIEDERLDDRVRRFGKRKPPQTLATGL